MRDGEHAPAPRADGAKDRDYWWTVFATDPIAIPLTRFLVGHRWLSPDATSYIALALGVAVGPVFMIGTTWALMVGAALFYVAFVFDCIDGKLARALGVSSPRGAALDRLADVGRRGSASLGLSVWLWRDAGGAGRDFWWAVVFAILYAYYVDIAGADKLPDRVAVRRWSAFLARHRLLPHPGTPDLEAIVFIIGPLTTLVVPGLVVGLVMVSAALLLTVWRYVTTGSLQDDEARSLLKREWWDRPSGEAQQTEEERAKGASGLS